MTYTEDLNRRLVSTPNGTPLVIDLFAGCGGLSLGFEAQGFATIGFEKDADCCATYERNLHGKCHTIILTAETELPKASVLIGGPPCQPFSVGGHQLGLKDSRDGFPIFIAAVKRLQPELWLFENVRGLLYSNKWYFEEIVAELQGQGYAVESQLLNAVDYGVPQNRERVVVVGHRGNFSFPPPVAKRVTVGDAIGDLMTATPPESKFLTPSMDVYIAKYERASACVRPRDLRSDEPSRTVTCRNLAGATGDMLRVVLPDGRRRRVLIREAGRLQSFPDHFAFCGGETSAFNQAGNAVPPLFAYHLAASVRAYLDSPTRLSASEIVYRNLPAQLSLPLLEEPAVMRIPDYLPESTKPKATRKVINEALFVLSKLDVPFDGMTPRRLECMAMCFLAVADVKRSADWTKAKGFDGSRALKSRDIITYINSHFDEEISSGSYDDIRRKHLQLPVAAGIIIKSAGQPDAARNDPTRAYAIDPGYAAIIRQFGMPNWDEQVDEFLSDKVTLAEKLSVERPMKSVPVKLPDGRAVCLSPGEHNRLQKAVIEEFLPRYGCGAEILYVGDTAKKMLVLDEKRLKSMRFFELAHGELPDIVAYSPEKHWLYLIEAVYSSGPISPLRLARLQKLTSECEAEIVFVTAFLDRDTFRKFAPEIAWETEVWIADAPDHVIHFDGERFFGPYKRKA